MYKSLTAASAAVACASALLRAAMRSSSGATVAAVESPRIRRVAAAGVEFLIVIVRIFCDFLRSPMEG